MNKMLFFFSEYFKWIITLLTVITFLLCLQYNFNGLYGQDGYAYLNQLTHLDILFSLNEFYPPFYALSGSVIQLFYHDPAIALQIVSLLSWLGTTIIIHRIFTQSFHAPKVQSAVLTFLCFFISPFVIRMGILVMSDALTMFIGTSAIYWGLFSRNSKSYLFFFIAAALGVLTRYALGVLLIPIVFYVLIQLVTNKSWKQFQIASIGAVLGLSLLILNFIFLSNKQGSTQHAWLQLWDINHFFAREFDHKDGLVQYGLPNILYVFKNIYHPLYFILFLPAIFFIRKSDVENTKSKILLVSVITYALFLAGIPFQNNRFLLLSFPMVVILLYPALNRMNNWLNRAQLILLFFVPVQLFIAFKSIQPIVSRNRLEHKIASALNPYQKDILYSFDIDIALEGQGLNFQYYNLWKEEYHSFYNQALVLFNVEKFEHQWKNKKPMINWNNLNENYNLELLLSLDENWKLYRIISKK